MENYLQGELSTKQDISTEGIIHIENEIIKQMYLSTKMDKSKVENKPQNKMPIYRGDNPHGE